MHGAVLFYRSWCTGWSHNKLVCSFCSSNAFITYFWTRVCNFFLHFKSYIHVNVYVRSLNNRQSIGIRYTTFFYLRLRVFVHNFSVFRLNKMYISTYMYMFNAVMLLLPDQQKWKTRRECADRINKSYARTVSIQLLFIIIVYLV